MEQLDSLPAAIDSYSREFHQKRYIARVSRMVLSPQR